MKDAKGLTALRVDKAKWKEGRPRLHDEKGLALLILPSGVKTWQFRFRRPEDGKADTLSLGKYHKTTNTLADAREKRDWARDLLEKGKNPKLVRRADRDKAQKARDNTFGSVAHEWIEYSAVPEREDWLPSYKKEVESSISNHLGDLRNLPIAEAVKPEVAMRLVRKVQRASPSMGSKVYSRLIAIVDFAVESGDIPLNPLPRPKRSKGSRKARKRYPAVLTKEGVGAILRSMEAANGGKGVKRGALLLAYTAQRIGEIVPGEWTEVDFDAATWTIPRGRMKLRDEDRGDHVVPLPRWLLAQMKEWHRQDGEKRRFICPSPTDPEERYVSREAVEKHFRRELGLAGVHSPHSFRSVLSSWAADEGEDGIAVEIQLDHTVPGAVRSRYDRAIRLAQRKEIMQRHEDRLLAARDSGQEMPKPATRGEQAKAKFAPSAAPASRAPQARGRPS